jgi:hypothetical protein
MGPSHGTGWDPSENLGEAGRYGVSDKNDFPATRLTAKEGVGWGAIASVPAAAVRDPFVRAGGDHGAAGAPGPIVDRARGASGDGGDLIEPVKVAAETGPCEMTALSGVTV